MSAHARGAALLAIAREAIARLDAPSLGRWDADWLQAPGASFVTLRLDSALRGCIGSVEARRALGEDVAHNAHAAAYRDPRFPPVSAAERAVVTVEVSVLSPREPVPARSESEALELLRPRVDGLYLEFGERRATFLPQVWDSLPHPPDFLGELRRKAGLPAGFWHEELRLSRYTVEKFA